MFTNIISYTSSCFDLLQSKTRSTSNLTDFLFLIQLSRNFTHVFTNIMSCTSLHFDLLRSKSNLTDFLASPLYRLLFLIRLSRNFTHMFTNIIYCTSSRFDLLWSKIRSKLNLIDFLYYSTDFISYLIVTKLHTRVHKHNLL